MTDAGRAPLRLTATLSLVAAAAIFLAACAAGGGHRRDADGNLVPTAREIDPASTFYSDTVEAAEKGDCAGNIQPLTCFAYRGHGYEGAQTTLGQCLMRGGQAEAGIVWLKRAAEGGWPDAQKALAKLYLKGTGVPQSNVEAGLWTDLYSKNPSLLSLGVVPDMTLAEEVRAVLSADERTEARRRADNWLPSYWTPSDRLDARTAATCRVKARRAPPKSLDQLIPSPGDPNY
jgi:TPR repeat protein